MKDEYDFSDSIPNPYAERLKRHVTVPVEEDVVNYFQNLSKETSIPYQTLINLYLKDCVQSQRKISLNWAG